MTHTHDTLMALADTYVITYRPLGGYKEARAALSAAIAELIAERDALQAENLEQARLLGISGSREAALLAERDALARDAARYRWLRPALTRGGDVEDSGELVAAFSHLNHTPSEAEFDAAIDQAMKGTPT